MLFQGFIGSSGWAIFHFQCYRRQFLIFPNITKYRFFVAIGKNRFYSGYFVSERDDESVTVLFYGITICRFIILKWILRLRTHRCIGKFATPWVQIFHTITIIKLDKRLSSFAVRRRFKSQKKFSSGKFQTFSKNNFSPRFMPWRSFSANKDFFDFR